MTVRPRQRSLASDCLYGGFDWRSRPAEQTTHTSTRCLQYDPMLLQSLLSQALPCGAAGRTHGRQFVCRAMLWFFGRRWLAAGCLPRSRVCCVSCVLFWYNPIVLCAESSCGRFSASECSAGTRVAPFVEGLCLAGCVERTLMSIIACCKAISASEQSFACVADCTAGRENSYEETGVCVTEPHGTCGGRKQCSRQRIQIFSWRQTRRGRAKIVWAVMDGKSAKIPSPFSRD